MVSGDSIAAETATGVSFGAGRMSMWGGSSWTPGNKCTAGRAGRGGGVVSTGDPSTGDAAVFVAGRLATVSAGFSLSHPFSVANRKNARIAESLRLIVDDGT